MKEALTSEKITLLDTALLIQAYCAGLSKSFGGDAARHKAIDRLQNGGFVTVKSDVDHLEVTEKGKCFVEAIRALPEPEQIWMMPQ